jgi:hypothetical protein
MRSFQFITFAALTVMAAALQVRKHTPSVCFAKLGSCRRWDCTGGGPIHGRLRPRGQVHEGDLCAVGRARYAADRPHMTVGQLQLVR